MAENGKSYRNLILWNKNFKTSRMKKFLGILLLTLFVFSCKGQSNSNLERNVGGPCQDCEALLDYKLIEY